ncbi:hypothetical protein NX773_08830 [Massilia solisilvae]|uniref:Uncharacterized protein n=1 Tax=Massilia solisilvae TaxID=1811225 RepID=A0ABT2BIC3_9BURK|nr:hypothetical protein [Massilia solisilvae]MCS0608267.1 hypothetical protein [Massilia solisilvae]
MCIVTHRRPRVRVAVLGVLAGAIGLAAAAGQPAPATNQAEIGRAFAELRHQVREAAVVVRAEGWSFPRRMTEADLSNHGCTYDLEDDTLTDSLLDTLAAAQFQVDPTPQRPFSAGMAVYLKAEGKHVKLILEQPFVYESGAPLSTGDARGTLDGAAVVAKAPLYAQIRDLVQPLKPTRVTYGCASTPK